MLLISNYIARNYTLFTLSGISGGIDVGEGNILRHDDGIEVHEVDDATCKDGEVDGCEPDDLLTPPRKKRKVNTCSNKSFNKRPRVHIQYVTLGTCTKGLPTYAFLLMLNSNI